MLVAGSATRGRPLRRSGSARGGAAVAPAVSNQTAEIGGLTTSGKETVKLRADNGTLVSITAIVSQVGAAGTWSAANGRLVCTGATPTGDHGITLVCSHAGGNVNVLLNTTGTSVQGDNLANCYSCSNSTDLDTIRAISVATLAGKTILLEPGVSYSTTSFNWSTKAYASEVIIKGHYPSTDYVWNQTNKAKITHLDIVNTNNVTVRDLEFNDTTGASGTGALVGIRGTSTNTKVHRCEIHGTYRDPNGDYSAAGSYVNPKGIGTGNVGGNDPTNITVTENKVYDVYTGLTLNNGGTRVVARNELYNIYFDYQKHGGVPTSTLIEGNYLHDPIGLGSDGDGPHMDACQFEGQSLAADWEGIIIRGNCHVQSATSRGAMQGMFLGTAAATFYYSGAQIYGNLVVTDHNTGIVVEDAKNCQVWRNVAVQRDLAYGNRVKIGVGTQTDAGGNSSKYNIAEDFSMGTDPTNVSDNNVNLGLAGALIPYADVFAGANFNVCPTTFAAAIAKFVSLAHGDADLNDDGVLNQADAGYTNFTTFDTAVPGATGPTFQSSWLVDAHQFVANGVMVNDSGGNREYMANGMFINEAA